MEKQGILAFPGQGRLDPKDAEIRHLKRENEKLRQQPIRRTGELLKKAMGIVSEIER